MAGRPAPAQPLAGDEGEKADREKAPSGRLLLRMPRELHAELARAAEREGTSLNAFITGALAGTIGWQGEDGEAQPLRTVGAPERPERRQARLLFAALVANAFVVGIASVAALGILLLAWLG